MVTSVNAYFTDGCGRCSLYQTPQCRVHKWEPELHALRTIINSTGLNEELKWGHPCYTYQQKNIILLGAFKEYCVISFLKGALLQDAKKILQKPGESSQSGKVIRFTNVKEIQKLEPVIKAYIFEAIEVEKAGLKVDFKKNPEPVPEELQKKLDEIPVFKAAFNALTPGRQRGYILFFSQAKQSKTREARIEKYMPQILNGKGLND